MLSGKTGKGDHANRWRDGGCCSPPLWAMAIWASCAMVNKNNAPYPPQPSSDEIEKGIGGKGTRPLKLRARKHRTHT